MIGGCCCWSRVACWCWWALVALLIRSHLLELACHLQEKGARCCSKRLLFEPCSLLAKMIIDTPFKVCRNWCHSSIDISCANTTYNALGKQLKELMTFRNACFRSFGKRQILVLKWWSSRSLYHVFAARRQNYAPGYNTPRLLTLRIYFHWCWK